MRSQHRHAIVRMVGSLSLAVNVFAGDLDRRAIVTAAELPLYPPTAIAARLEGTVVLAVRVSKGVVQQAEPMAGANALLASAARRNALTWKFSRDVSGSVNVRFIYELEKSDVVLPENPEIQMRLPEFVRIMAKPVKAVTMAK